MQWNELILAILGSSAFTAVITWLLNRQMYKVKIKSREAEIKDLEASAEDKEVTAAGKLIDIYSEALDRFQGRIENLEHENKCLGDKLNKLEEDVKHRELEIQSLREEVGELRKENEKGEKYVRVLRRRMRMLARLVLSIYHAADGVGCLEEFISDLKIPGKDEDFLLEIIAEVNKD